MTDPSKPEPEIPAKMPSGPKKTNDRVTRKRDLRDSSSSESFSERQTMMRLASAGFELASFSLILGAMGYGIDYLMGNRTPYFAVAGVLLGFVLGFYRLIVLANKLS